MADRIYLSLWLSSHGESELVPHLGEALRAFPQSQTSAGIAGLSVHPLDWSEPEAIDENYSPGAEIDEVLGLLEEYAHDDYAIEAELHWDLWQLTPTGWRQTPLSVRFTSVGEAFDGGVWREQGHLLIDLGFDAPFLAEGAHWDEQTRGKLEANIRKLLELTSALERRLPVVKRVLWSESESDLAQKLMSRLQRVQ